MNITTPSTVVSAGGAGAQPEASVEAKGIFVPRKGPLRRICCQGDVRPKETASHPAVLTDRTCAKPVDPLTTAEVQENPELASFLSWLEKNHTTTVYQFIGQHLTDNTDAFAQAVDKQSTPNNCEAIFEALCRQVWQ